MTPTRSGSSQTALLRTRTFRRIAYATASTMKSRRLPLFREACLRLMHATQDRARLAARRAARTLLLADASSPGPSSVPAGTAPEGIDLMSKHGILHDQITPGSDCVRDRAYRLASCWVRIEHVPDAAAGGADEVGDSAEHRHLPLRTTSGVASRAAWKEGFRLRFRADANGSQQGSCVRRSMECPRSQPGLPDRASRGQRGRSGGAARYALTRAYALYSLSVTSSGRPSWHQMTCPLRRMK